MLKRYAFLIGSTQGVSPLPSVRKDLSLMKNFLMSCTGGGWNSEEIRIFLNRPVFDVLDRIEHIKGSSPDYFVFYWSGHGQIENKHQLLQFNSIEVVSMDCFLGVAERQLMIMDTCRNYHQPGPSLLNASRRTATLHTGKRRRQYRKLYDHYIATCPPSLQIAYSCQPGQYTTTTRYGGLYTTALVDRALRWDLLSNRRPSFATIQRLMQTPTLDGAVPDYYHSAGNVNPRCFPFAVRKHC